MYVPIGGIITSSITYPAEKIANGSPIFANKWRIRKTYATKNLKNKKTKTTKGTEGIFPEE